MRKLILFLAAVSLVLFAEKALCYETTFSIEPESFNSFRYEEMREQKAAPLSIRTGRFLSVDPVLNVKKAMFNPQGWNRYSYVRNNPINRTDPDGRDDIWGGPGTPQPSPEQQAEVAGYVLLAVTAAFPGPEDVPMVLVGATKAYRAGGRLLTRMSGAIADYFGGQPGAWRAANEAMSARAAAYQMQVGGRAGQAYFVNGVKFDSFRGGTLVDAKGPGYAQFVKDGQFVSWFRGADALVAQAQRQVAAAGGTTIQWHVAEQAAAAAMRKLLEQNRIRGIEVVYTSAR